MDKLETITDISSALNFASETEEFYNGIPWYRGQADAKWKLFPSAFRQHPLLESQMAQFFRLRAPGISAQCPSHLDYAAWLPLMRHYGIPTRLLDWTESLLVALFFAANEEIEMDGKLYALLPHGLNAISIGNFVPFITDERVADHIIDAFKPDASRELHNLSIYAPRSDTRMQAQKCCYTIHGNSKPLCGITEYCSILKFAIIPKESKRNILNELRVCGVTLSSLFPDLHHLAKEISELVVVNDE